MSWLDMFQADAEKRNAESRRMAKAIKRKRWRANASPEAKAHKKAYAARWRAGHKEQIRENNRKWREKRDVAAYQRAWRAAHPGKNTEYCRRHRQKKQTEATTTNQGQTQKTEK